MAKFHGKVGYGTQVIKKPGVVELEIIERAYYGDVISNSRQLRDDDRIVPDISVGNAISIVADAYANEHFFAMQYVRWAGSLWTVSSVDVQRPRLILRLGGVYNGPTPTTSDAS